MNIVRRLRSPAAVFVALVVCTIAGQAIVVANRRLTRPGDFDISREFGRRLLAGEPLYGGGLHYPYLPSAALYFAPLALLPPWLGLVLRYVLALVCLGIVLRLLHAMLRMRASMPVPSRLMLSGATIVLAAHYILRDLDDGGPHLILLAMLVTGIYCGWRGWAVAGGAWLGLAAALKAPNALFLPFLLWKRQWRLAAAMTLALGVWMALPILWMGPASWVEHHGQWLRVAFASAGGAATGAERQSEDRVQNQALRPALGRAVGNGPGMAVAVICGLIVLFAWLSRPSADTGDLAWVVQSSAVMILSLLLSPVTWVQHLVLLIPALYLIVASGYRAGGLGVPATAAMALYVVLSLLLNREVVGRDAYLVFLAHGIHTWCMLLLLAVLWLKVSSSAGAPASVPGAARSAAAHASSPSRQ